MNAEGLRVGQLVRSKAGRDAGLYLLVLGVRDAQFVVVADGKLRRVARPKLKRVRHLEVLSVRVREAEVRFAAPSVVTDRTVAEAISELLAELGLTQPPTAAVRGGRGVGQTGGGGQPEEDVGGYGQEGRD
jgi:hypothetical protein